MHAQKGLSFVETIATTVVLGTLVAIAAPSFSMMLREMKATSATNHVVAVLQQARIAAITRGRRITLCRSVDGRSCTDTGNWAAGAVMFVDDRPNGRLDAGEAVLTRLDSVDFANLFIEEVGRRRVISFRPDGSTAGTNITLAVCDASRRTLRLVVVSLHGRIRSSRDASAQPECPGARTGRQT